MPKNLSPEGLATARHNLTRHIHREAERIIQRAGFGWYATADAPSTYKDLKAAYVQCVERRQPLPVSDENSETVIWDQPQDNFIYRFVHDMSHVEMGLGFTPCDEFELAHRMLARLERSGYRSDSLEWQLYAADAVGQTMFYAITKRFVTDQLQYAVDVVAYGLDRAIVLEMERQR